MARLAEQRKQLPDQPGVYIFRDGDGRALYVGKAKSIKKRVNSHFTKPFVGELIDAIESIDYVVVETEAEALFTEQNFIKQQRPLFNIRLRDDKSYPYIAISVDEDFPRVYFTRESHRPERLYFGPYSSAKRVRATLDLLTKIFQLRSCEGREPGRRSGSPCLDYYIKRCGAPCVGYVTKEEYRRNIDGVVEFLSGRYREIEGEIERRMYEASEREEFEQATLERNRLWAVRSLLERQRVANESIGTLDAIAIASDGVDANAQIFQVRDGVLLDRQSFYLDNRAELDRAEIAEEFIAQYYGQAPVVPPLIVVAQGQEISPVVGELLSERRGAAVEIRAAERGDKRRIAELAERNARLALSQEKLRTEHRRQRRAQALDELKEALALESVPLRIECYDISNLGGTNTTAAMVVFEGGVAKKADYRRFKIKTVKGSDDFAAIAEVLARRSMQWERQHDDLSPHDPSFDRSFAALPDLIVIDGGKGQLSSGLKELATFRERGVAVIALAKRLEEVFLPGRSAPLLLPHTGAGLQLLQRVRDEAHRFAISHHRSRRDSSLKRSALDGLAGVGPRRKQLLLKTFGSPDAVLGATREQLEAVPGLPGKVAREIYAQINKVSR